MHTYTDTHQTRTYDGELIVPHSNARNKNAHNDWHDGRDGDDGDNGHDGDDRNRLRRKSQRAE